MKFTSLALSISLPLTKWSMTHTLQPLISMNTCLADPGLKYHWHLVCVSFYPSGFLHELCLKLLLLVFQAFGGIAIVIPLREKMKHPQSISSLIVCAMLFMALLYWSFGSLGQIAFGQKLHEKGSITIALPENNR